MTACEHPEEALGPLEYDGRPANPEEWECLDCGYEHAVDVDRWDEAHEWRGVTVRDALRDLGRSINASGVMTLTTAEGLVETSTTEGTIVKDLYDLLGRAQAELGPRLFRWETSPQVWSWLMRDVALNSGMSFAPDRTSRLFGHRVDVLTSVPRDTIRAVLD